MLLAQPGSEPRARSPAACLSSELGSLLLKWKMSVDTSRLPSGLGDAVLLTTRLFTALVITCLLNPQEHCHDLRPPSLYSPKYFRHEKSPRRSLAFQLSK